jgi:UDP-N-acetylmuramoyl-tripeptide--D-alanyl-D-alanine ligase
LIELSQKKLAEVVNGTLVSELDSQRRVFRGVCHNTLDIRGGELFIALQGEKTHGHSYIDDALGRGAALCLVEDESLAFSDPKRIVVVSSTLRAYWDLAGWWRKSCRTPLIAVTGSVGKTTVKEMVAAILLTKSLGFYSERSYNNHTGVPYTLCKLTPSHLWGVVEIGMNHRGEIAPLAKLVAPNVVLVTKIEPAHIGALGSMQEIAREKLSIIEGLESEFGENGAIILNGDDQLLCEIFRDEFLNSCRDKRVLKFGSSSKVADLYYSDYLGRQLDGSQFTLNISPDTNFNDKAGTISGGLLSCCR